MVKKIIYAVFVVLLGYIIYTVAAFSMFNSLFADTVRESVTERDHSFILNTMILTQDNHFDPTPIYRFDNETDTFNLAVYEYFSPDPRLNNPTPQRMLAILITELNLENISTERVVVDGVLRDLSRLNFHFEGERIVNGEVRDNIVSFELNLSRFNGYLVYSIISDAGLAQDHFGNVLTDIEFVDSEGNVIFNSKDDAEFSPIDFQELRGEALIEYPNSLQGFNVNQAFDAVGFGTRQQVRIFIYLGIYALFAVGLGYLLFRKTKTRKFGT
ncbi:MAG: hypothetical protein FWE36_05800 [Erysipelotrichales bacterium]|nr:hypothetical protein [Erysipelotrichales bacterium]